jgi:transposase-like protein
LLGNFGSKEEEMTADRFTAEFKRDAVAQVEDRGYPVREVAERLALLLYPFHRLTALMM